MIGTDSHEQQWSTYFATVAHFYFEYYIKLMQSVLDKYVTPISARMIEKSRPTLKVNALHLSAVTTPTASVPLSAPCLCKDPQDQSVSLHSKRIL